MTERRCPRCNSRVGGYTSLRDGGDRPSPGAISICAYCAAVLVYAQDLQLRPAGFDDLVHYDESAIRMIGLAVRAIKESPLFGRRR